MGSEVLVARAGATGELDNEALAHEVGAMESRNDVTRIHRVFVLDEAEAVHELDLCDLAGAVSLKVGLDIGLGGTAGEVAQVQAGGGDLGHGGW